MYFFTIEDGMSSTAMPLGESPRFSNALFITPYGLVLSGFEEKWSVWNSER